MQIAPGVYYSYSTIGNHKLIESAHMVEIDTKNPHIDLKVKSTEDKVGKLAKVREIINDRSSSEGSDLIMGVNGDFFSHLGIPSGLQISNGEVITSPVFTKVVMGIKYDRSIIMTEGVAMSAFISVGEKNLVIDAVNRTRKLKNNNHMFLYNSRFRESTKTPADGIEVVILLDNKNDDRLLPNQPISGKIKAIKETANTSIKPGSIILSATGSKAAWVKEHLAIGTEIKINTSFNKGINDAKEIISGNATLGFTLLRNGEIDNQILDADKSSNLDRHPRTMIATKEGKLYIVIIDGRQPGFSDGITMSEGAHYLLSIGMRHAINIDGGGSTTCYVRKAGDLEPTLLNRPSDGFEREVGNALLLMSSAPASKLERIVPVQGSDLRVLVNSRIDIKIKGHDQYVNPLSLNENNALWEVNGNVGEINSEGHFFASKNKSDGEIVIRKKNITEKINVNVVEDITRLSLSPTQIIIEPKKLIEFKVTAYDDSGFKVWVSKDQLTWEVRGDIGTIDNTGFFQAINSISTGTVVAKYNGIQAESKINIGQRPELITGFESIDHFFMTHTGVVNESIKFDQSERPAPVRFGRYAGRLKYDFTGMSGTSKVTINFTDELRNKGTLVKGRPYRFGLWVYGDSKNHWLRLGVADKNGETQSLNFTTVGGLNWTGWKYVYADIPNFFAYPIKVLTLYLIETSDANKNNGTVYFDNLRAEYIPLDEDVEGPIITDFEPRPNQKINNEESVCISAIIQDHESGVNPASIKMTINEQSVDYTFKESTGKVKYEIPVHRLNSLNTVTIEASDNASNATIPNAEWLFSIV